MDWHLLSPADAAASLRTDPARGLAPDDAAARLRSTGPNELSGQGGRSPWSILYEQLTATMVVLLLVAAAISLALRDYLDAVAILVIVALNAALGFYQEYRAERAMAALQRLAVPNVRVRRDGRVAEVPARDLVPGDVMLLEAGNIVAADGRLVESANLRVQEAALTGESEPVDKHVHELPAGERPLAERRNLVFMGTGVAHGRGAAIVTSTGMATELGRIATLLQSVGAEPTPLQRRLDHLGKGLAAAALAIVAVVFALGLLRGDPVRIMFLTAVSMAVAAVPEGLPAVVTMALALGAQRMLRRRALVRRLSAVETLGSVTVICSDKTGTLTESRMTVTAIDLPDRALAFEAPYPRLADEAASPTTEQAALAGVLAAGALCNDAVTNGEGEAIGDPTEVALAVAAARAGLARASLDAWLPRIAEVPFDADRKRMSTVHAVRGDTWIARALGPLFAGAPAVLVCTKGAPERVLEVCSGVWSSGGVAPLDAAWRAQLAEAVARRAAAGMRVLGVAARAAAEPPPTDSPEACERDLVCLGFVAMIDPPRPEAAAAVATCRAAGIRPVMITGDDPLTARTIAGALGIGDGAPATTGPELDAMDDSARRVRAGDASVFARVSPEHKLRLVEALQQRGEIVAMTGDGVNDAPALKKASIGVAMGITGTDVSKQAADIVLLDDNFATIVAAVEEGRVIYDNIRKFVRYLLATNSAELLLMLVAPLTGMPLPLQPLQILWINLVTDGPTALTLAVEPAERGVMARPPVPPGESLFARGLGWHVLGVGVLMTVVALGLGYWKWQAGDSSWQTVVFTTTAFAQLGHVLAARSSHASLFTIGVFSNVPMLAAVAVTVALQVALVHLPAAQAVFATEALSAWEWAQCGGAAAVVFAAVELDKWRMRRE